MAGGEAGGGAGAGGGGGAGGDGDGDGNATRWCAHCRKEFYCQDWWIIHHRVGCERLQQERAADDQRRIDQARFQRLERERKDNRRRAKESSNRKGTASSKGKGESGHRN